MSILLYRVRDGLISFRRHENYMSTLNQFLPIALLVNIPVDPKTTVEKQVRGCVSSCGWVGRFIDVDSPAGQAMLGNRHWDIDVATPAGARIDG